MRGGQEVGLDQLMLTSWWVAQMQARRGHLILLIHQEEKILTRSRQAIKKQENLR